MPEAFVAIGSNIEPERNLAIAIAALTRRFERIEASSVYRSAALGFEGDDFLNMVVRLSTQQSATALEQELSAIEYSGERVRASSRFAPRMLDLDLVLFGQCVEPLQRLPRDDVSAYPFVLGPLAELAPDLRHPVGGGRMIDLWREMRGQAALVRVGTWTELESLRRAPRSPADAAAAVDR